MPPLSIQLYLKMQIKFNIRC